MFVTKTLLLLSLLCTLSAAAAVPVETVQEEQVNVSVPGVAAEEVKTELPASVDAVEGVVEEENTEVAAPDEDTVQEETAELSATETATDDKEEVELTVLRQDNMKRNAAPPSPVTQEKIPSKCPTGWHAYKDNCYMLVNYSYSWTNADFMCESLGASLASAHSLWEYSFLKQLAWRAGHLTAWIGGYRFQGYWKWDDSTPFDYNNWYSHTSSSYDCIYLNSQGTRGWSSERCNLEHPFICSMKASYCQQ